MKVSSREEWWDGFHSVLVNASLSREQVAAVARGADVTLREGTAELITLLQDLGVRNVVGIRFVAYPPKKNRCNSRLVCNRTLQILGNILILISGRPLDLLSPAPRYGDASILGKENTAVERALSRFPSQSSTDTFDVLPLLARQTFLFGILVSKRVFPVGFENIHFFYLGFIKI